MEWVLPQNFSWLLERKRKASAVCCNTILDVNRWPNTTTFLRKIACSVNPILSTLARLYDSDFTALAAIYNINCVCVSNSYIKSAGWSSFAECLQFCVWVHVHVSICIFVFIFLYSAVILCMYVFFKFVLPTGVINHNNKNVVLQEIVTIYCRQRSAEQLP